MMNKQVILMVSILCGFTIVCMEPNDFALKTMEEGNTKIVERSPEPKRLAQVHAEIKETLSSTNENFVYLNGQLQVTNSNIVAINTLLSKILISEKNIIQVHSDLKYATAGFACCLCCCIIVPIWILLGYVASNY